MKNEQYTLEKKLPLEIRREVYIEAHRRLKDSLRDDNDYDIKELFGTMSGQLCLILPCILWDLPHYMYNGPHRAWHWEEVGTAFPEIQELVDNTAKYLGELDGVERIQARIDFLNKIIETLID